MTHVPSFTLTKYVPADGGWNATAPSEVEMVAFALEMLRLYAPVPVEAFYAAIIAADHEDMIDPAESKAALDWLRLYAPEMLAS